MHSVNSITMTQVTKGYIWIDGKQVSSDCASVFEVWFQSRVNTHSKPYSCQLHTA